MHHNIEIIQRNSNKDSNICRDRWTVKIDDVLMDVTVSCYSDLPYFDIRVRTKCMNSKVLLTFSNKQIYKHKDYKVIRKNLLQKLSDPVIRYRPDMAPGC